MMIDGLSIKQYCWGYIDNLSIIIGEDRIRIYKKKSALIMRSSSTDVNIVKVEPAIDVEGYKNRFIHSVPSSN